MSATKSTKVTMMRKENLDPVYFEHELAKRCHLSSYKGFIPQLLNYKKKKKCYKGFKKKFQQQNKIIKNKDKQYNID